MRGGGAEEMKMEEFDGKEIEAQGKRDAVDFSKTTSGRRSPVILKSRGM